MYILTCQTAQTLGEVPGAASAVFFVQCRPTPETHGPIRIGTARNLAGHLGQLVEHSAYPLYFLGLIPGADANQRKQDIHRQFAGTRMHGEWFRPSLELFSFIQGNAQVPPPPTAPPIPTDQLFTIEDVARLLNVSVPSVRRLVDAGRIPTIRIGRQLRFRPSDLAALRGNYTPGGPR